MLAKRLGYSPQNLLRNLHQVTVLMFEGAGASDGIRGRMPWEHTCWSLLVRSVFNAYECLAPRLFFLFSALLSRVRFCCLRHRW